MRVSPAVEVEVAHAVLLVHLILMMFWRTRRGLIPVTVAAKGVLEAVAGAKRSGERGKARGAVRWPAARAGGGDVRCGARETGI